MGHAYSRIRNYSWCFGLNDPLNKFDAAYPYASGSCVPSSKYVRLDSCHCLPGWRIIWSVDSEVRSPVRYCFSQVLAKLGADGRLQVALHILPHHGLRVGVKDVYTYICLNTNG